MRAFELYVNGKRICVAGVGDKGVLTALVAGRHKEKAEAGVSGLVSATDEHVEWTRKRLKTGDEVRIKIVEVDAVDRPKKRYRSDPIGELAARKQYVRKMAKQLGWKITVGKR
jgi:hypothetical protein